MIWVFFSPPGQTWGRWSKQTLWPPLGHLTAPKMTRPWKTPSSVQRTWRWPTWPIAPPTRGTRRRCSGSRTRSIFVIFCGIRNIIITPRHYHLHYWCLLFKQCANYFLTLFIEENKIVKFAQFSPILFLCIRLGCQARKELKMGWIKVFVTRLQYLIQQA